MDPQDSIGDSYIRVREKGKDRIDDTYMGEKIIKEIDAILLWCMNGLLRLKNNNWKFSVSERMVCNGQQIKEEEDNIVAYIKSDYVGFDIYAITKTKDLYDNYLLWCRDNVVRPKSIKSFSQYLHGHQKELNIEYTDKIPNDKGVKSQRGYKGVRIV